MRELIKKAMRRTDVVKLGKHQVKIAKITPAKWRPLVESIQVLPQLIANVAFAPPDDFAVYALQASEVALDDLLLTVSILSGIDVEELENEAGIDEIVDYIVHVYEHNNIDDIVKKRETPPADTGGISTETDEGGGVPIYTIDDFLRDCAVTLGVPQKIVEDEYYILDLPDILAKTREYRAAKELRRMQMLLAASGRQLPEEEYKRYITSMQKAAGINEADEEQRFSREKMDELRAFTDKYMR
ncbi:tail assembly protein [Paenibacillus phage Unity]|uniref:Tail assembly protein n=6 Tax=root TaxID=1 RepID=A0A345AVE6_9CAUD|nr:tail assembly protein [Paenibacillus phage Halcyone]YP_010082357.1 tail assembly protein [Paenibacillus phage Scottie]YP_010082451.1 tail assembly protein [Paenibacillus phage Unity]AXF40973.1 tail assembly protein [Paenibacillus phage Heath]AXF40879.1 tail assembly protein [Paenibacillus phage Scottie]AXF41063.1 tail assembly protein [Paenibacillus phage Halcyone]AXF42598.1 tail assembly protein [Paenibacillus phage Unity]